MTWDADSAELFLDSEIEWNTEPALSAEQQLFLLNAALVDGEYTIESLGAAVYLGLSWKLKRAMVYHDGNIAPGEYLIYNHLKEQLEKWAVYADGSMSVTTGGLELFELEVGQNYG